MLHQLLFGLLGKPGSIILLDPKTKSLTIDRSLTIFKSHEINALNQLLTIGSQYLILNELIAKQTDNLFYFSSSVSSIQSSTYNKCIALSLEEYLKEYQNTILSIENEYLKNNKHFTLNSIMAQLMKYRVLFPEIIHILRFVFNQAKDKFDGASIYGGAIIDYLYQKYLEANQWIREVLRFMLSQCYRVFIKQINQWMLYGQIIDKNGEFFVHRVTWEDAYKKFKPQSLASLGTINEGKNKKNENLHMKRIEGKNIEITDWDMYTLQATMIPKSFIKRETAGKVLFIGKSTKILKSCDKIPILPEKEALDDAKRLLQSDFESNVLEEVIEKIRKGTAQKMINLILGEQNLLKELQKLNEYYLMAKGDFYHLLMEQSINLDKIPQKQKAVRKLNDLFLPNTFMRLNSEANNMGQDTKKVSFELRPSGFSFESFRTFNHLCPVGNIDLVDGKAVKFNGNDGALWCKSKQNVENDFSMGILFKFKKNSRFFRSAYEPGMRSDRNISKAVISIVIQNDQEVSTNSHSNPHNLRLLEEYLSIDVGFVSNEKQTEFGSFMKVVAVNQKNGGKPYFLGNVQPKKLSLQDQNSYYLKIAYKQESKDKNLKITLSSANRSVLQEPNNEINIDLCIPYYLNLQMGRAHVGFISNLLGSDYSAQIEQWKMICTMPNHFGDHWSDICLHYKVTWPLDLILTSDVFENYSRVHKFLFPIRQTQIQIDRIWHRIPRRIKQELKMPTLSLPKSQLLKFQRILSLLRNRLSLFLSQLWKYCQEDIKQETWHNFSKQIQKTDDFEILIALVNKYIKAIQSLLFFSIPRVQNNITGLVRIIRNFVKFFQSLQNQKIDENAIVRMEEISTEFDDVFREFVYLLGELSTRIGSHHLYHLAERMNACWGRKENQLLGKEKNIIGKDINYRL